MELVTEIWNDKEVQWFKGWKKTANGKVIIKAIREVCSNPDYSWLYPKVTFLPLKKKVELGLVNKGEIWEQEAIKDVNKRKFNVYLSYYIGDSKIGAIETIVHELTHLFQVWTSLNKKQFLKSIDRLEESVEKLNEIGGYPL